LTESGQRDGRADSRVAGRKRGGWDGEGRGGCEDGKGPSCHPDRELSYERGADGAGKGSAGVGKPPRADM